MIQSILASKLDDEIWNVWNYMDSEYVSSNQTSESAFNLIFFPDNKLFFKDISIQPHPFFRLVFPRITMRGDRRCSSFRKEKPAGLSRALSWLSVSNLSRQSRRIFHSQSELHAVHNHQTHSFSHTHLYASDRDKGEDDDDWVYHPQHKKGEGRRADVEIRNVEMLLL